MRGAVLMDLLFLPWGEQYGTPLGRRWLWPYVAGEAWLINAASSAS
jgi:hypothetical protein